MVLLFSLVGGLSNDRAFFVKSIWKLCHVRLLTNVETHRKNIEKYASCKFFVDQDETIRHLLYECELIREFWEFL